MTEHIEVRLGSGSIAFVDAVDGPLVVPHRWQELPGRHTSYAKFSKRGGPTILMHRLIIDAPRGVQVDHINRNGLDNRRVNLRLATPGQNNANAKIRSDNTSGYKGVCWSHSRGKIGWYASIHLDGKQRGLGLFDDPWEAAQAYNAAALEQWGEFAFLNERRS